MKINIGAGGTKMPGYISVDAYNEKADIIAPANNTGFQNNSVDKIFCSHMLEHIDRSELDITLKHWHSILKPGGKIIILVPNAIVYLQEWIDSYNKDDWKHLENWGTRWIMGFEGKGTGMYHTNLFTVETLIRLFKKNKFIIKSCSVQETRVKNKSHFEYRNNGDIECIVKK